MLANLLVLVDSAFPSGSHGHSNGLEYAILSGWVTDAASLEAWGRTALLHSLLHCDGRALLRAHSLQAFATSDRTGDAALLALNAELAALRPGMLQREASAQVGRSFLRSSLDAWGDQVVAGFSVGFISTQMKTDVDFMQYPLAWGVVCAALAIDRTVALQAFLLAAIRQMTQVAVRIMNIGQREALAVQIRLGNYVESLAIDPVAESAAGLESAAFRYDMAGLGHESLERRYFRS